MKPNTTPLATTLTTAAASASALFALQHQADAGIIYSGPQNISATLGTANSSDVMQNLNLDAFGGDDFGIRVNRYYGDGFAQLRGLSGNPVMASDNGILKLGLGELISAGRPTYFAGGLRVFNSAHPDGIGNWLSGETGFAGVKFSRPDGTHYGWIHLVWTDSDDADAQPNTLTALDWAYQSTPDAPIAAGQTVEAVPEPGTALFGLAMAGAAALRRKRTAPAPL